MPRFAVFSKDQRKCIVSGQKNEVLFVDITKGVEEDIFDKEGVSEIKNITSDDENFWILGNRKQNDKGISNLGIYLFNVNLTNPRGESNYLL